MDNEKKILKNQDDINFVSFYEKNDNGNFRETYGYFEKSTIKNNGETLRRVNDEINVNREKYLPIGSIVNIKEVNKKIMIIGFLIKLPNKENKVFDYMGCLYPEGVMSLEQDLLFNHEQIVNIHHIGYIDQDWLIAQSKLTKIDNAMKKTL